MNTWSLRAQKNARQGQVRVERQAEEWRTMATGPHLANDGHTLIVPSCWFQLEAASFWRNHGFTFDRSRLLWWRDTRQSYKGKRYTAAAWLESTRREFYKFWPKLLKWCTICGQEFTPTSRYQLECAECAERQNQKGETDED